MREDAEVSLPEGAQAGDGARSRCLLVEFLFPSGPHINIDNQSRAVGLYTAVTFIFLTSLQQCARKPTNEILTHGPRLSFVARFN